MNENRCVCCGDIIPEGRMVCPKCYEKEWMIEQLPKSPPGCFSFREIARALKEIFQPVGISTKNTNNIL